MGYILTNVRPILAATLAALALGVLWLWLFAPERLAGSGAGFALAAFVAAFWLAAILAGALILAPPRAGAWTMALGSAVVIWIGFVLPALVVTLASRDVGAGGTLLDAGYWLAAMVLMAAVMQGIGLTAPPDAS